jgi:hypothetical protein
MMMKGKQMAKLMLSAERVREELFTGGFRPMSEQDFYGFADAEAGSLIADISVGRFHYVVIFTPSLGDVQIYETSLGGEPLAWEMDLLSGLSIEL